MAASMLGITKRFFRVHGQLALVLGACSTLLMGGLAACGETSEPYGEQVTSPAEAGTVAKPDAAVTASDAGAGPADAASPGVASNDASAGPAQPRADAATMPATPSDAGASEAGTRDTGTDTPTDASSPDAQTTSDASTQPPTGQCGRAETTLTPFGCRFAWGTNDPTDKVTSAERLGFVSKWVGYEVDKAGNLPRCDGCSWLPQFANKNSVPVYYAYFIGFLGSANGFADQNVNPNGPNLATDGAQLIRSHRAKIIDMYASYARQSAQALPKQPLVWLLEGDFVQYTYKEQKQALSMQELGQLARDITCAIKSNMPNAVVAINHTTWLSNEVTNSFWETMASLNVNYDLVWTTGVANNNGFFEKDAKPGIYNEATAKYAYVAQKTGRKILVDTSFGLSGMSDSWASASAAVLNARIADGVIAANVTMPPSNYVSITDALGGQLNPVCR